MAAETDTRVAGIKRTPLTTLKPWDDNPRTIAPEDLERLKRSLTTDPDMLWASPLVYQKSSKRIIFGNARHRAATDLGWFDIPAAAADVDAETAVSWALRDNSHYGEWDATRLQALLADREPEGLPEFTGFRADDLLRLLPQTATDPLAFLSGVETDGQDAFPEAKDLEDELPDSLLAFSISMTTEQRTIVMGVLRRIRSAHPEMESTTEALVWLCGRYDQYVRRGDILYGLQE